MVGHHDRDPLDIHDRQEPDFSGPQQRQPRDASLPGREESEEIEPVPTDSQNRGKGPQQARHESACDMPNTPCQIGQTPT